MKHVVLSFCLLFSLSASLCAQQWYYSFVPGGRDINAVYIQNPGNSIVAGGHLFNDSIQSMYSTNTIDWNYLLDVPFTRGMLMDLAFTDSLHGYACGYNGNVIKSTDAAQNWTLIPTPIASRVYKKLAFVSPSKGFAVGTDDNDTLETIITTIDSGRSWTTVIDQPGHGLNAITFISTDTGFAVGDQGVILKTVNGGASWVLVSAPVADKNFINIKFINSTGYIVGGDDTSRLILSTTNRGATWTILKNESGSLLTDITFYQNKGYIVGNNSTLLRSANGGQSWTYDTVSAFGPVSELTSIRAYNDSFIVVGAKHGYIFIYTTSSPPTAYTLSASLIDSADASLSMSVNTHKQAGTCSFIFTDDPTWQNYFTTYPMSITTDSSMIVRQTISALDRNKVYYFIATAQTIAGTTYGDTMQFFTGTPYTTFNTLPATNTGFNVATLNGAVNKFLIPVTVDFEYGTTPSLGLVAAGSPASIDDTLAHSVTAALTGLQPGTIYYYRMRGITDFGTEHGNISTFFTGTAYTEFSTNTATYVSDTTATLNGSINGFVTSGTLGFEYGTTPSFGNTATNVSPGQISDTSFHQVIYTFPHGTLQPNTLYFYRLIAQTSLGTFYGNTLTFYTGSNVNNNFTTLGSSAVTASTATMNGSISHFPTAVSVSFEYGTTQSLSNTIAASPASITDTDAHIVSAPLANLNPNTVYYYRLKGTYTGGTIYGAIRYFYTGNSDIPNWDFQEWYGDTVELPYYWLMLTRNFVQVPGHSSTYAPKLLGSSGMILGGLADQGGDDSGPRYFGGAPLHSRPDSIIAYMNYYAPTGDSMTGLYYLYKDTSVIAKKFFIITGSSGGTWQRMAIPIEYTNPTLVPDSIVLGFITLNPYSDNKSPNPNSYMAIDDISLYPPPPVPLPNAGFEDWFTFSHEIPVDWNSVDYVGIDYATLTNSPMVKKAYYNPPFDLAIEVANINIGGSIFGGGVSTSPVLFNDGDPSFPVFIAHQTLNGFYKFYPDGPDTLQITVTLFKNGQQVGVGSLNQGDTVATFTPFEIPIMYYGGTSVTPDSGVIKIEPHHLNVFGYSRAIVDKLSFDGYITGIEEAAMRTDGSSIWVYPNPASGYLTIETAEMQAGTEAIITDINGRIVRQLTNSDFDNKLKVDVSDLSAGMYLVSVKTQKEMMTKKIVINR